MNVIVAGSTGDPVRGKIQDLRFTAPRGSSARLPSGRSHARHYSSSDPFPCNAPGAKLRSAAEPDLIDIIVRYIAGGPGRISYHQFGGRYLVDDRKGRALETKVHILFCISNFTPSGRRYVSTKAPAANVCTITIANASCRIQPYSHPEVFRESTLNLTVAIRITRVSRKWTYSLDRRKCAHIQVTPRARVVRNSGLSWFRWHATDRVDYG